MDGRHRLSVEAGQVGELTTFADRRARLDPADPVPAGRERMVRVGGDGTPQIEEFAAAEAGAALGISTGAARCRLADALDLTHRLPHTLAAEERRQRARDVREVYLGESRDGVREVLARLAAGDATRLDARVDQLADTDERRAAAAEPTPSTAAAPAGGRPVPATMVYLHLHLHLHLHRDDDGAARWEQAARDGRCPRSPRPRPVTCSGPAT